MTLSSTTEPACFAEAIARARLNEWIAKRDDYAVRYPNSSAHDFAVEQVWVAEQTLEGILSRVESYAGQVGDVNASETLQSFNCVDPTPSIEAEKRKVLMYASRWAENIVRGGGWKDGKVVQILTFASPCKGVGKTHFGHAIAREMYMAGVWCEKFAATTMFKGLHGDHARDTERRVLGCRVLIIDDLGVNSGSEFEMRSMLEIIDSRSANSGQFTLITTNGTSVKSLLGTHAGKAPDHVDRLQSRLSAGRVCIFGVEKPWPDYRGRK